MGLTCLETGLTRGEVLIGPEGNEIGFVTAGAWSPYLNSGIALIRLKEPTSSGHMLKVMTPSGLHDAKVVDLPFYDPEKLLAR